MTENVGKEKIKREPGYLYYIGKDGYVWASPMKGKPGTKKKVGTEKIEREKGFVYFLGSGDPAVVGRAPRAKPKGSAEKKAKPAKKTAPAKKVAAKKPAAKKPAKK